MNVSIYSQMEYENKCDWTLGQSKPNSKPIKPNLRKAQMNVSILLQMDYENKRDWTLSENKPNQTQFPSKKAKINFCCGLA